jgi:hypothetical protein
VSVPHGLTLLPAEEVDEASSQQVAVTMTIGARDSAVVGRFLDLIEHAARLAAIDCALDIPGWQRQFYGWDKRQP